MRKALVFLFPLFFVGEINAQCYQVAPTVFVHDSLGSPITPIFADDQYSGIIQIGFPFCFYGQTHSSLLIGSNGVISFDTTLVNGYCPWPIGAAIPTASVIPLNSILFPFQDLYINAGGTISYQTIGSSPNRKFILELDSIGMYSCFSVLFSGQVKLYETSNIIEIHIAQKNSCASWNGGYAIEGIQNSSGTAATVVPGRNFPSLWNVNNDAWSFNPTCNVCSAVGIVESPTKELNLFVSGQNQISIQPNGNAYKLFSIYNMLGQEMNFTQSENTISVANVIPGIYFLNIEINGIRVVKKVMMN